MEAAKTIAQRGVVLIATAHGNTLGDLMRNPTLRDLVGGVGAVTLGDSAAKTSNSGRKVGCWRIATSHGTTKLL